MPDAPSTPAPAKSNTPASSAAKNERVDPKNPSATSAPEATQNKTKPASRESASQPARADAPASQLPKASPLTITLGAVSVVLLVAVVVLGNKLSDRNTTIVRDKNRADQYDAAATQMQTQLDAAKAATARVQSQL